MDENRRLTSFVRRKKQRPYGSWLARHTTAPSPGYRFLQLVTSRTPSAAIARRRNTIARPNE